MTELERYYTSVYDGRITACLKIQKQAEKILESYITPGEFHYDNEIAQRHYDLLKLFVRFLQVIWEHHSY